MKNFIFLSLYLCLFVKQFTITVHAQKNDITLKIKSENKEIFNESGMLKELADDFYFSQIDKLKKDITEWFRSEIKVLTKETMYSDKIELNDSTSLNIRKENGKLYILYKIYSNDFMCRVTTPDGMILGSDGFSDSRFFVTYDITGTFELIENGLAESIRLANPTWIINVTKKFSDGYWSNGRLNRIPYTMPKSIGTIYTTLNEVKNKFNQYIKSTILNHPELKKEFEIDETKTLVATVNENTNTLTFTHKYSPSGIVKRNATTDPGGIADGPKSTNPTTVPTSDKPGGGVGGRNGSTKPPPFIKKPGANN
jgi:hypothetical protein